jgi:hypothetical protein
VSSCVGKCKGKFVAEKSTTYKAVDGPDYMMFFSDFNVVTVSEAQDTLCLGLDASTCVKDFWFRVVKYATDMEYTDGFLGLATKGIADDTGDVKSYMYSLK